MNRTHILHVSGMHCASCVVLTEEALRQLPRITSVQVSLKKRTATISGDLPEDAQATATLLSPHMPKGYSLAAFSHQSSKRWHEFVYAVPISALFFIAFIALQKTGLAPVGITGALSLGTALLVGLIASVSTCLAVVGGLVLSVSASYAQKGERFKPQTYFHIGRLASFFLLGGLLGLAGKSLQLDTTGNLILTGTVALIMFILGVNLLDVFHTSSRFQIRLPKQISRYVHQLKNSTHSTMPLILGAATFFLPCGFTQSMQAYALTTGSFLTGGITMLIFAIGTLPMLALLSFSSLSINDKPWRGIFFKTAGLIVIALALINLLTTLAVAGIIDPVW